MYLLLDIGGTKTRVAVTRDQEIKLGRLEWNIWSYGLFVGGEIVWVEEGEIIKSNNFCLPTGAKN